MSVYWHFPPLKLNYALLSSSIESRGTGVDNIPMRCCFFVNENFISIKFNCFY